MSAEGPVVSVYIAPAVAPARQSVRSVQAMAARGVVISLTDSYRQTDHGEPIVGLKSFILSPFADEVSVEALVEKVLEARGKVGQ